MNNKTNTCKIVLVGDAGCGKTCIISRFVNDRFDKGQMTTACPSFCTKSIKYKEYDKTINLDIWDTACQEIYRAISKLFYKKASIGLLIYDITNIKSFNNIREFWYNELKENAETNIIFNVVGNKVDLFENEQVDPKEAKEFAKSINAGFYLTSAKSNSGIEKLFIQSGMKFIDPNCNLESLNNDDVSIYDVDSSDPKINDNYVQKKKKCC